MRLQRLTLALAFAAAAANAGAVDLIGVYRDAQVSDPVYQSNRAIYQATIEKLPQARAGYLPLLSGTASWFRNDIDFQIAPDQTYNTKTYAVSLSQPIFRLQNWIAIGQAKYQVMQAEANLANSVQDLGLRVAQAYFDVLLAQDNVALSETQKTAIDQQLAQAKRNFEVGTATIVDTLEAQARYDQSVAKEIFDKADLETKRRALQVLLGKLPAYLAPLRDPLELAPPEPNDVETWVRTSEDSSFTIASAKANFDFFSDEVARQRAGHLPNLDLSGNYTYADNPSNAAPGIVGPVTKGTSVGVVLSIPLYSGGLIQSRVREALANRTKAEQDLENSRRTVAQNVRVNFLNVTAGIALVRALEQALTSTKSQLDSTILGRDVGVRTSVDVLNAQQSVFQARRDLQQARYNYLLSTLRLKAATGTLNDADIEAVNRTLQHGST
jgi:outer membrane protein